MKVKPSLVLSLPAEEAHAPISPELFCRSGATQRDRGTEREGAEEADGEREEAEEDDKGPEKKGDRGEECSRRQ